MLKINKNQIIIVLPAILILLISFFSFSVEIVDLKGLFVLSLLLLFPLIFFIQGLYAFKFKTNYLIPLLISLFSFLVVLLVYLNSSALPYMFFYTITGCAGFYLPKLLQQRKEN